MEAKVMVQLAPALEEMILNKLSVRKQFQGIINLGYVLKKYIFLGPVVCGVVQLDEVIALQLPIKKNTKL